MKPGINAVIVVLLRICTPSVLTLATTNFNAKIGLSVTFSRSRQDCQRRGESKIGFGV